MYRFVVFYTCLISLSFFMGSLLAMAGPRPAQPGSGDPDDAFLQQIERSAPDRRIRLLLNHFHSSQAFTKNQPHVFRLLDRVDSLGQALDDTQLGDYAWFLREADAHFRTASHAQNAALMLAVGQKAEAADKPQIAAVCRHMAGQYFFFNEDYGKAFEHLLAANARFRAIGYGHVPGISHYLYELAFAYFHFQEYSKAVTLLSDADRYPAFNANEDIQTANTLGMAHTWLFSLGDTNAARRAEGNYRIAQHRARLHRDTLWIGIAAGNLARLYINQQRWADALPEYRTSYRIGLTYGQNRSLPDSPALDLAEAHLNLGQLDSTRYYMKQALVFFRRGTEEIELSNEYFQRDYCNVARKYYRAIGDLPTAYRYLDSLNTLNRNFNKRQRSEQISLVNQKLMIQKHQSDMDALQTEKQAQQNRFWIVGVALALMAGLFFRLYQLAQLKRRQERVINAERERVLRLEKKLVEEQLQQANADLNGFMENLREKNKLIDAITAELAQLTPADGADKPLLETQRHLLHSSLLTPDDWYEFRQRFDRVYPHFFEQLHQQFAGISPAEERLLALSKLRVDTRQMSRMLGISPDSIHKTRYRLRKKLTQNDHSSLLDLLNEASGA
ncbi:hypothetical protein DYU11_12980 [Fibrisoma montanum]|uniref:HTH luxR-type domain-containing protein n=1 Tax=Fibrisoma montanum TaxID=2305895 RepID=A0A418MBW8_9BACT|nr:hypothetical protein [Fibrisoma montanum]RIV23873.1 hypothetical protein DYU11_12980 [Fibrisoma montanum]